LHKEQVSEIIREAFESYWKDEELYHLHVRRPINNFDKTQTHFEPAFEYGTHGSEERNEDGKMEVDLVVAQ
jgi:hypothetical protein